MPDMQKLSLLIATVLILFSVNSISPAKVQNAAIGAYDLTVAVNSLRADNDLAALSTSVYLMAAAQNQANYLATTYGTTPPGETEGHIGADGSDATTRAEEAGYVFTTGMQVRENWAGVSSATTLDELINSVWGDADHTNVMLQPYGIQIGAGVAQVEETVYYVLNVVVDYASSPTGLATSKTETPEVVPVDIATSQADGSIIHTVEKGQALWSIAITYGVTVDQLRILNNLSETANIYEGQQLYVRAAYTQTPTLTSTVTPMPPTRTPIPPQTPQALKTQAGESTSNTVHTQGNREVLGIALIVGCGIGLAFLIYSMIRKKG